MSAQPPAVPGPQPPLPESGALRCPRCSATVGPDQDWCLECGAPARTRLAQTPNWQLPTVAIGAIVLLAGAMLAFAFVRLTDNGGAPAAAPPTATTPAPATTTPPAIAPTTPAATTPPAVAPTTTPGAATAPPITTATPGQTTAPPTTTAGRTTPANTTPEATRTQQQTTKP